MKSHFCIFFLAFFMMFFSSCVQHCDGNNFKFRVRMEIILKYDDTLEIQYSNSVKNDVVRKKVAGNLESQFVEFCLPEEPNDLHFVFKGQSENKGFKILNLLLENNDNQMFLEGEDNIHSYFLGNKAIKYNQDKGEYNFISLKNFNKSPALNAREALKDRLNKRLKP